jgi:GntR family transcriptional regulator, rspAB operon transcriptional repressor
MLVRDFVFLFRFVRAPMPLAQAAYEKLRNMILTGELPPETAITENSIVDRLGIGKTPVREAMRRLVLEGLLDVTPRLGYTVTAITQQDVEDLFQMRVINEVAAAQLAADRLSEAAFARLTELSSVGYAPDDRESMLRYIGVNAEFHDIIARGSGNARLADLIDRLMQECRRFIQIAILSDAHGQLVIAQHVAIIAALRARDPEAVEAAVRAHVEDGMHVTRGSLATAQYAG